MKANKLITNALELSELMIEQSETRVCYCYFGSTWPTDVALEYGIIITPAMRKAYFYEYKNWSNKPVKVEFNLLDVDDRKEFSRCINEIKRNLKK